MFCIFAFSKHLQSSFLAKNVLVINKALICCKKDCRVPFFRAIKMQTYVILKGHSQLVHMRIRYHFLADLHITLHHKSRAEKRILWKI